MRARSSIRPGSFCLRGWLGAGLRVGRRIGGLEDWDRKAPSECCHQFGLQTHPYLGSPLGGHSFLEARGRLSPQSFQSSHPPTTHGTHKKARPNTRPGFPLRVYRVLAERHIPFVLLAGAVFAESEELDGLGVAPLHGPHRTGEFGRAAYLLSVDLYDDVPNLHG
jgi:hypothetical protein